MDVPFSHFVGDISTWTSDPQPGVAAATKKKGCGVVSRSRKEYTVSKLRNQLDTAARLEEEDHSVDLVEATRCIAQNGEDEDPELPVSEPM